VATHLGENTHVEIGRTPENTPSARLVSGKVRMIDPRDDGAPAQLSALDADAHVMGNDAEAYIFSEKVGPYAMMCEWDDPLPVTRGKESKTAAPGDCVIAKPKEPLYTANAHDQRIPALAQECGPGPALAFDPNDHLSPTQVAAAGPVADNFQPAQFDPGPGYVCDQAGVCSPVVNVVIAEPPPVVDPCPPGFCPGAPPKDDGPPAPPVKDNGPPAPPIANDGPPAPPIKDGGPPPITDGPPAINDGPPPFANTPPAPPVQDVPVFTDTPPAPPVENAPPFQPPPSFPPSGNGPKA
jgi:hypothetical protein